MEKSQFIRNLAFYGGACLFDREPLHDSLHISEKSLELSSSIFYSNLATSWGDGIYTTFDMIGYNIILTNVYFFKQIALLAAGLCLFDLSSIHTYNNCSFISNMAEDGGGIYISSNSIYTFTNCKFIFNAAISIRFSVFSFYDFMINIILSNVFAYFSSISSMYIPSFSLGDIDVLDLNPYEISDHNGGAFLQDLCIQGESFVYIWNTLFKRNLALDRGGAIIVITGVNSEYDSKFIENYAVHFGGAFDLEDNSWSVHENSVYWRNSAGNL